MVADQKIAELLKLVATCKELTDLFSAVTERFDYLEAKNAYLRFPATVGAAHGVAYLPEERGDVLAFVFCLFVEIDGGAIHLNDFLLRYFYEDGSYTASYARFAERMIKPFRDIVSGCFPHIEKYSSQAYLKQERQGTVFERIASAVNGEIVRISQLNVSTQEKEAGELILSELLVATGRADEQETRALLCGYGYFLRAIGAETEQSEKLFVLAGEL